MLRLPERARVRERLTKKLLLDSAAETSGDRKLIGSVVAGATVEAVLTPATLGIAEHREPGRRVHDIAVISVALAVQLNKNDQARILDLLHRSMPRPVVVLLQAPDNETTVSVALSRVSQTDDSRSVVEAAITAEVSSLPHGSLSLVELNRTDLWAYYCDLARAVVTAGTGGNADLDAERLITERHRLDGLEAELATATRRTLREKSLQKRIDLNMHAKALRAEIEDVRGLIYARHQPHRTDAQPRAGS
ncbi:hypothetical protein CWIS_04460 [Cellulomonas sp. A375-1]|nr:hypothetical protein CWIS_04460 [Cellulomonas sp. A375-1]